MGMRNILWKDYIGTIFHYSLLRTSKFGGIGAYLAATNPRS